MSEQIKGGGPAFPIPLNQGEGFNAMGPADGMTLRDYFAAKALQALIAEPVQSFHQTAACAVNGRACHDDAQLDSFLSEAAYRLADAMLRTREVQP